MIKLDFKSIESKWQNKWTDEKLYSPSILRPSSPFYNLWMFPYPSGEGLHVGHAFASTGSDIYGRFMRMQGRQVFQPIGYDSFGIHSENFALKIGEHPQKMLARTIKNFERQLRSLGHGYDWTRTVTTSDPNYYQWTQWLFTQLFKKGLAYRKEASVNWCPSCKTVLADEQVIEDRCERCQSQVEKRQLMQWFFRITEYADRLLKNLESINWPDKIKTAQQNWIGKSQGHKIKFDDIEVFTTRIDTLHGATFVALAPDYPRVIEVVSKEKRPEVGDFIKSLGTQDYKGAKDKLGVFTGKFVTNPATGKKIPVWVVNYVSADYGTGAIMGVPAFDDRDREFATKYKIDIVKMTPDPKMEKYGEKFVSYHLRDWLISRQRYWGPPIPMIFCSKCDQGHKGEREDMPGWYSVPEADLPVFLPDINDYQPDDSSRGPLSKHPEFYTVSCPGCGAPAKRETDVSDTFLDSAWYFLRYPSVGQPSAAKEAFDQAVTQKWLPVNLYFGGAEHAVLHLMYARFVTMVLHDLGKINFEEPFPEFYAHGLMIKDGAKMSKSRGNVINPDQYIEKYGADTFRLYLMFIGPMDGSPDFRDSGMDGMYKFVNRLWKIALSPETSDPEIDIKINSLIGRITTDIQRKHYNTAIAAVMEFVNFVEDHGGKLTARNLDIFIKLLAPFAPHLAEDKYQSLHSGSKFSSVHSQPWPEFDPKLSAGGKVTIVVQVNGNMRDKLVLESNYSADQKYIEQLAHSSAKIEKYLNGAKTRTIFVPGKVINLVII